MADDKNASELDVAIDDEKRELRNLFVNSDEQRKNKTNDVAEKNNNKNASTSKLRNPGYSLDLLRN
ncbi:MAG: hypothetical protein WCC17_22505 [Candidatus Nitrosopolaris sp.]